MTSWASEQARSFFWRIQRAPEQQRRLFLEAGGYHSLVTLEKHLRTLSDAEFRATVLPVLDRVSSGAVSVPGTGLTFGAAGTALDWAAGKLPEQLETQVTGQMLEQALEGLTEGSAKAGPAAPAQRPLLIAVTQLTSTSQKQLEEDLLIHRSMEEVVASYAALTKQAGLDGVVCSPLEAPVVHQQMGSAFLTITPGVRLAGDAAADQTRVTTPAKAKELGSDYIVVGRSITGAANPVAAYERCCSEFIG